MTGNRRQNRGRARSSGVLRKRASIISMFSPRFLDWLLAIRRVYLTYHNCHGFYPSIMFPVRFTEKIQWRKLFDLNPIYSILCDKLAVRDFVRERVGSDLLVPLLWSGDDPDAIPFDSIEPPYIIKSSHATGHTIIFEDKALLDKQAIRETARSWLSQCHGTRADEPGYVHVPHALMLERLLSNKDGSPPREHKIFVFHGRVRVIQSLTVSADRARFVSHHTPDWIELPWWLLAPRLGRPLNPPRRLNDIIKVAETLGAGFDHLRVDLYECDDRIYAGEMTLYSHSGLIPIKPDSADFVLGAYWRVRPHRLRALWAILARNREILRQVAGAPKPGRPGSRWAVLGFRRLHQRMARAGGRGESS
jgi:TupA-like ATPgrasp